MTPGYLRPVHLEVVARKLEAFKETPFQFVFSVPPRHGKAVANETPMLTRRGWVTAGDVHEGDELVGRNGAWTKVLGVFPQGEVPLHRVSFSDGAELVTCGEHLWEVTQRYGGPCRTRTTAQLAGDLLESDSRSKWRIPVADPWHGEAVSLPLDPYLLGVWLGDGTAKRGEVTSMDPEIPTAFRAAGFATSYEYKRGLAATYGIPGLITVLKALGVHGNKHVPVRYMGADIASRLALLQGLCDTDGTVARNGSQQTYTTTSERLAMDFRQLVSSLGGTWTEYARQAAAKTAHTISFRLPKGMAGFRLHRKASRLAPHGLRNTPRRFVKAVEPAGVGAATCFAVEAADHLFCAGRDFVVTHNSELLLHWITWALLRNPTLKILYVTYNAEFAITQAQRAKQIARNAGLPLANRKDGRWLLAGGGIVDWQGMAGTLTGRGYDVIICDDPTKGIIEANSKVYRDKQWMHYQYNLQTRLMPGGSFICLQTRWHEDDLAGRLTKTLRDDDFDPLEYINIPAIAHEGTDFEAALWPEVWTLDWLRKKRRSSGAFAWAALFQGRPRPVGGSVFGDATFYSELPSSYQIGQGIDLAYTERTSSDWNVCVTIFKALMAVYSPGDSEEHEEEWFYVRHVVRKQARAPEFRDAVKLERQRFGGGRMRFYGAGTETGSADYLKKNLSVNGRVVDRGIDLEVLPPKGDKFLRAIDFAAAWNDGRVLVPSPDLVDAAPHEYAWLHEYLDVIKSFTGVNDAHDDDVDASVAAFDVVARPKLKYPTTSNKARRRM